MKRYAANVRQYYLNRNLKYFHERKIVHQHMKQKKEEMLRYGISEELQEHWQKVLLKCCRFGGISNQNYLKIYSSGDEVYSDMWREIDGAKERVWVSTYIFDPDRIGQKFLTKLGDASKRGCEIKLLYDYAGSVMLQSSDLDPLDSPHAEVLPYNVVSWSPPFSFHRQFLRNHQKIHLIDTHTAFCGGMNIGEDYCSPEIGGNGTFRDTHVRLKGPAVQSLEEVYLRSLFEGRWHHIRRLEGTSHFRDQTREFLSGMDRLYNPFRAHFPLRQVAAGWQATGIKHLTEVENPFLVFYRKFVKPVVNTINYILRGEEIEREKKELIEPKEKEKEKKKEGSEEVIYESCSSGSFVQVLGSHTRKECRVVQQAIQLAIRETQKTCYVTTPYFLPPRKLKHALLSAAKKGVEVEIMTSGKSDVKIVVLASRYIYRTFLQNGIRIFEMEDQILHSKSIVLDGIFGTVGSYNFDLFSERNLEVNVATMEPEIADALTQKFKTDLSLCKEITLKDLEQTTYWTRAVQWIAFQACRFISKSFLQKLDREQQNQSLDSNKIS